MPGSGAFADRQGLLGVGLHAGHLGGRLEAMYTGVPGADLVAVTANLLWTLGQARGKGLEPYLIAGAGRYIKFLEGHTGLNGGVGVRRRSGSLRLFAEVRYHRLLYHFREAPAADTFLPVSFGVMLGR